MRAKIGYFAVILLIACIVLSGTTTAQDSTANDRTISVTGTGTVTTDPDRATVSLAVETEDVNVGTAQEQNALRMNSVIDALTNAGLSPDDLQTTGYSIYPVRDVEPFSSKVPLDQATTKYYRVTNTLVVTLADIDRAGEIIDLAVDNGADRVNYISFSLSDEKRQELRAEALNAAVDQGRNDAQTVADALGVSILAVKEVNVGSGQIPYRYAEFAMAESMDGVAVSTPIEPSTVDVTATVSISYLIG